MGMESDTDSWIYSLKAHGKGWVKMGFCFGDRQEKIPSWKIFPMVQCSQRFQLCVWLSPIYLMCGLLLLGLICWWSVLRVVRAAFFGVLIVKTFGCTYPLVIQHTGWKNGPFIDDLSFYYQWWLSIAMIVEHQGLGSAPTSTTWPTLQRLRKCAMEVNALKKQAEVWSNRTVVGFF